MPLVSIVVPVFNEEANLQRFHDAVSAVMLSIAECDWEFVFVDDGSRDRSFGVVEALRSRDNRVTALRFARNFGSHVAIAAGIDYCHGDCAVIMAADLQDPPEVLREFVDRWREGYDVVWGARSGRDDGALRGWFMKAFYAAVRRFAIPNYPKGGTGSFCLISRKVVETFRQCTERNRLTFGLIAWSGFREIQVPYHRPSRAAGSSSWTFGRLVKSAIDTFISFSFLPIRAISYFGLVVSFISFVFGFYVIINKLAYGTSVQGWTSVMLAVLLLGGVQLTMIGVLGEYLWRILDETRGRPLYVIDRSLGFPPNQPVASS
ncbi:MAG TPA: glycosyltransferase family 2 protein [Vicinamibacterales bacterium]|jgi:dolichol-phosphate mannosyltransferase|nr:glycosyltransferase family 2 protein [Vicinamibacterales bacterium]